MVASFNQFSVEMTLEQARSASHPGPCDSDVQELCKLPKIRRQLAKISDADLGKVLREYGAWDDKQLLNRVDNEERIIWIAAGNIAEEYNEKHRKEY